MDKKTKETFLTALSHSHSNLEIDCIIKLYESEQEFNQNIMTTGNSEDEVMEWLRKHAFI